MKRCSQCILPANYPRITFDEKGVCNFCRSYKEREYLGDEALLQYIHSFRRIGQDYDCLVGLSGGRDSSYLIYYFAEKLHLKVLAYHFDHGFIPEETTRNVLRVSDRLKTKLITEKSDILKKCIAHHLSAWIRRPTPAMIGMLCTGCRVGTDRGLIHAAKKYRVPYIAYGGHPLEGGNFKLSLMKGNLESKAMNIFLILGYVSEIVRNPAWIIHPVCLKTQIMEYALHFSPLRKISEKLKYAPVTSSSPFYRFIRWEEKEVVRTIRERLGWQSPEYGKSTWRTDCKISILKNYLYREILGFNDKEDGLSCLVRAGQITREEALERAIKENEISEDLIAGFVEDLGLRYSDLQAALTRGKAGSL